MSTTTFLYLTHTGKLLPCWNAKASAKMNDRDVLLQSIFLRLQEAPFSISSRQAKELDAQPSAAILQLLYDLFAYLDPNMALDVHHCPEKDRMLRTVEFLDLLDCPLLDNARWGEDAVVQGLREGRKTVIYRLMAWCLENPFDLRRRACLSRCLSPVEISNKYLKRDMALSELYERFRELQNGFISVHKALKQARSEQCLGPHEMRKVLKQLEKEHFQIREKLEEMKRAGQEEEGFDEVLAATISVREEDAKARKLDRRLAREENALATAKQRLRAVRGRVDACRGVRQGQSMTVVDAATAWIAVEALQQEVWRLRCRTTDNLHRDVEQKLGDDFEPMGRQRRPEQELAILGAKPTRQGQAGEWEGYREYEAGKEGGGRESRTWEQGRGGSGEGEVQRAAGREKAAASVPLGRSSRGAGPGGPGLERTEEGARRQLMEEKLRLRPKMKLLKQKRREVALLEEEHRSCLALVGGRVGNEEGEGEVGEEGGAQARMLRAREMAALMSLLRVKVSVCEGGQAGDQGGVQVAEAAGVER